jgi:chemotaxis protein histidine kinase CheA
MASVKEFVLKVVTGDADKSIQGVKSGLDDATKSTSGLASGFKKANFSVKAFGKALIATGIGAFVVAIGVLVSNLQNSESGFNRVQKLLKQLGVIAGNVTDIFYSLGTSLFSLVTGDFDQMNKSFEEAKNRMKNFGDETEREIKLQGELADKQADLVKLERQLVVDRAEANRKRADLLEKAADKENFTASQRIQFLKEAAKVDEEITNAEIEAAKIRLSLKEQENTLSESSTEDLNEEARLKAELTNLETARLTKQKTVTAQITSALREEQAQRKAIAAEEAAEQKVKDDAEAANKKAKDDAEAAKLKEEEAKELARLNSIDAVRKQFQQKIEDAEAETEAQKLELQMQRDLDVLNNLGATEEQKQELKKYYAGLESDLQDKQGKEELARKEALEKQKLALTANTLGNLAQLLGENSAAGKAAAIAQAVINSYLGFTEVLSSESILPQPLATIEKIASAGTILASGLQTVKQITAVKTPTFGKSISIGGGGGGSRGAAVSQPPAFNVVGASDTNQLAQAIGQQGNEPVKAYVVSNEVTNAQALDRNIVESASLG